MARIKVTVLSFFSVIFMGSLTFAAAPTGQCLYFPGVGEWVRMNHGLVSSNDKISISEDCTGKMHACVANFAIEPVTDRTANVTFGVSLSGLGCPRVGSNAIVFTENYPLNCKGRSAPGLAFLFADGTLAHYTLVIPGECE